MEDLWKVVQLAVLYLVGVQYLVPGYWNCSNLYLHTSSGTDLYLVQYCTEEFKKEMGRVPTPQ